MTSSARTANCPLFGPQPEQWSVKKARAFVKALQEMWDTWR